MAFCGLYWWSKNNERLSKGAVNQNGNISILSNLSEETEQGEQGIHNTHNSIELNTRSTSLETTCPEGT